MHPIEHIIETSMDEIKKMIDVNTIVGEAVVAPDGSTIIPISRVCFGFLSGGGEYGESARSAEEDGSSFPFAGGASATVSLHPTAFLVTRGDTIKLLSLDHKNLYEKIVDIVPQILCEIKNAFMEGDSRVNSKSSYKEGHARNRDYDRNDLANDAGDIRNSRRERKDNFDD
ncbi:MAG: GerW family sporulation protein [Eubacteriales bacterium]